MIKVQKYLTVLVRLLLAVVFIYAAVDKVLHPQQFRTIVENYQIFPALLSHYVAMFLPWFEIVCGLFLLIGVYIKTSAELLSGLMLFFIAALISVLIRGLDINCGCFTLSAEGSVVSVFKIFEDFLLLGMLLGLVFFNKPFFAKQDFD